jgi:hypothetical protein
VPAAGLLQGESSDEEDGSDATDEELGMAVGTQHQHHPHQLRARARRPWGAVTPGVVAPGVVARGGAESGGAVGAGVVRLGSSVAGRAARSGVLVPLTEELHRYAALQTSCILILPCSHLPAHRAISDTLTPARRKAGPGSAACAVCMKQFRSVALMRKHARSHAREKQHACPLCPLKFSERANLKRHVKHMHLQLRDFTCPVPSCAQAFSRKSHLVHHLSGTRHDSAAVHRHCDAALWTLVCASIEKRHAKSEK